MYRADLATFPDDKESDILKEFPSDMWIGASQNSSGHWNWLHTSSVDEAVSSSCGLLVFAESTYFSNNCQEPQEFVCQKLKGMVLLQKMLFLLEVWTIRVEHCQIRIFFKWYTYFTVVLDSQAKSAKK